MSFEETAIGKYQSRVAFRRETLGRFTYSSGCWVVDVPQTWSRTGMYYPEQGSMPVVLMLVR